MCSRWLNNLILVFALLRTATSFNSICYYRLDEGPCRALVPRYFYNSTVGKCEMFKYGGCEGNENNFFTEEECNKTCEKNKPFDRNDCKLPEDPGICRAIFIRYFYNISSNKCEKFSYGGCLGNRNRFESLEECKAKCETQIGRSLYPESPPERTTEKIPDTSTEEKRNLTYQQEYLSVYYILKKCYQIYSVGLKDE
ncbi:unnamed protein product [Heterobilharzia americana]|nr:unnamed protein product [Heterobilharzia americana]